ncbi:MAG: hypothetical protein IBX68_04600 [Dehalococcoidia bacterium]|nr:hypothetical protein [Dehalococcoidia bacterium]
MTRCRLPGKLAKRLLTVGIALAVAFAIIGPLASPTPTLAQTTQPVRLNMFYYGSHSSTIEARLVNIKPEYLITNTAYGFWGEYTRNYSSPSLLQNAAVTRLKSAGIKVIGYTSCGYEGRGSGGGQPLYMFTLDSLKKQIRNMALIDKVDGVFIDEIDSFPNSTQKYYLKELSTLARSLGIIIWGNTGVDNFDPWFFNDGGFHLMQATEQWVGQSLSPVQQAYGSRISVAGFRSWYTVNDAVNLTLNAWNKGIKYAYINTNEYMTIPPWFEQYANTLRSQPGNTVPPPANQPPAFQPIGDKTATEGQQLQFAVTASDPDGDSLIYTASNLPAGAVFAGRTFTWVPGTPGTYPGVTFSVSDGKVTVRQIITITVLAASKEPPSSETRMVRAEVATGSDDGFSGSWAYSNGATWFQTGNPGAPYDAWFRFAGVEIPSGATILKAHLETVSGRWNSGTQLSIRAELASNPTAPKSTADHANRARSSALTSWTSGYSDWQWHNSPDISRVIQELVNTFDYSSGANAIQILVDNAGSASGSEFIGGTFENGLPTRLFIEYALPSSDSPTNPEPGKTTILRSTIVSGKNDGFSGSWAYSASSSWFQAGNPGASYNAWLLFDNVQIPAGATIVKAHLETVHRRWDSGTRLAIRAEKTANPTAPTSTSDHAARSRTTSGVIWNSGYSDYKWHSSPDFAAVLQELVNTFDYSSGRNGIQILIDNAGSVSGTQHVGGTLEAGQAPRIYIEYVN